MANFQSKLERFPDLFDENFSPTAVHEEDGKLLGIELRINREGRKYLLQVETLFLQLSRLAIDETSHTDDDPTMVLPLDEIHISDLRGLKQAGLEELAEYLVEQED